MGRNVECDFLNYVESSLAKEGISEIIGEYIDTQKNTVVKDFWTKMGYTCNNYNQNGKRILYKRHITQ